MDYDNYNVQKHDLSLMNIIMPLRCASDGSHLCIVHYQVIMYMSSGIIPYIYYNFLYININPLETDPLYKEILLHKTHYKSLTLNTGVRDTDTERGRCVCVVCVCSLCREMERERWRERQRESWCV